jgi:myosin-6
MIDHSFEGSLCLAQLKYSGTVSVLELMEYGYPSRVPFQELYNMYQAYLPIELKVLQPKTFCEVSTIGIIIKLYIFYLYLF